MQHAQLCLLVLSATGCSLLLRDATFRGDADGGRDSGVGPLDATIDAGAADAGVDSGPLFDCSACRGWGCTGSACVTIAQVGAGGNHTCVRDDQGSVWCWGRNVSGQLGDSSHVGRPTPAAVPDLADIEEISLGQSHTCARRSDGSVWCWGDNGQGRLGHGMEGVVDEPTPVQVIGIDDAVSIGAGLDATCAARSSGVVECWGNNAAGALGIDPGTTAVSAVPVTVPGVSGATKVTVGGAHACAVVSSGAVTCWGRNLEGQIGNGETAMIASPDTVTGLTSARSISAGSTFTCAIDAAREGWCWGSGDGGELGNGLSMSSNMAVSVVPPDGTPWLEIDAGNLSSLGRTSGRTWSWGGGITLGTADTTITPSPRFVDEPLVNSSSVSVGSGHACAVAGDGSVMCWGANADGQVGDGTMMQQTSPVLVVEP